MFKRLFGIRGGTGPEQATAFWKWFVANEQRLFEFESDQARIFAALTRRLHAFDRRLVFMFGPKVQGRREFIVSAEGARSAFPAVTQLVKAAPQLDRWDVSAFRPRIEPQAVRYDGVELAPSETFFTAAQEGDKVNLVLFVPDRVFTDDKTEVALGFLMLDAVLGEYDVATKIGAIEIKPISSSDIGSLQDILSLRPIVDRLSTCTGRPN